MCLSFFGVFAYVLLCFVYVCGVCEVWYDVEWYVFVCAFLVWMRVVLYVCALFVVYCVTFVWYVLCVFVVVRMCLCVVCDLLGDDVCVVCLFVCAVVLMCLAVFLFCS